MKALFLSAAAPPSAGSHATRVAAFVETLHKNGHETVLLTCKWPQPLEESSALFARIKLSARVVALHGGMLRAVADGTRNRAAGGIGWGIYRRLRRIVLRLCIPDTFMLWIPRAVACGIQLGRPSAFDVVVSSGAPFSSHVAASLLSMILRIPLALDYGDPWVYEPGRRRTGLRLVVERWIEQKVIDRAHVIYVTTAETKSLYQKRFRVEEERVVVASMGYDPSDFSEIPAHSPPGPRVFVYAGKVNDEYRSLDGLAAFMRGLESGGVSFKVLFFGSGPRIEQELGDYVRRGLVESRDSLDHPHYVRELRSAHANIILGNSSDVQVPGKVANCLAARRPIAYFPNMDDLSCDPTLALLRRGVLRGLYVHGVDDSTLVAWARKDECTLDQDVLDQISWPVVGAKFVDGLQRACVS